MEKLVIQEEMKNCPGMYYFAGNNTLELAGRSIPENPELIFRKLDDWITKHFESTKSLVVIIKLEYINSGSSKYLYEILKRLTGYGRSGNSVKLKYGSGQHIKKQRHYFAYKGPYSQSYGFSSSHVWM